MTMAVNCTIHLDVEDQAQKPNELKLRQITNRIALNTVEVTPEQLANLVTAPHSRTWMPGIMNGRKKNENWIRQEVFAVDIDEGLSMDAAIKRLHDFNLDCTFAYSTFSSTPENEKFRMVFFLDRQINTMEEYEEIKLSFLYLFPEMDRHCTAPSNMFHGGREVIYSRFEYALNTEKLKVAADLSYIGSATSERTRQERTKKVAGNGNSINNIIRLPKSAEITPVRNFDIKAAVMRCRLLREFDENRWLYHQQLFGIATNLLYVKGGLKWLKAKMDENGKYNPDNYAIIPYVRSQRYLPQDLSNFSPYEEDRMYKNILQAGKLTPGEHVRHLPYSPKKLEEMETELALLMPTILKSVDKYIHIVKVPTGVGKTESVLDVENAVIACPSHDLKNEIKSRFRVPAMVTPELPKFSSSELNEKVDSLFKAGGAKLVMEMLSDLSICTCSYLNNPGEDGVKAQKFLDELALARSTDITVITTHHRSIQDFKHPTLIFDEDPLQTVLMPMEVIKVSDIYTLKSHIEDPKDRNLVEDILTELSNGKPNIRYKLKKFSFRNYRKVEETVFALTSITSPVMNFFDGGVYVVDENDNNKIYFSRSQLLSEDKKIIILSATANEWIYRQLYKDRVRFYDLGNVELKGKLQQDTLFTYSRQNLSRKEVLEHVLANVEDRLIITFADYVGKFRNARKDIYFGKCRGTNKLEGVKLAVVGTPHVQMSTYLLLADKLGLNLSPSDYRMYDQRIIHNNMEFRFYTFENQFLRNIQFFYIESELRQAVGRARLVRQKEADVLLFSNFPLEEASFCFEVTELVSKSESEENINTTKEVAYLI